MCSDEDAMATRPRTFTASTASSTTVVIDVTATVVTTINIQMHGRTSRVTATKHLTRDERELFSRRRRRGLVDDAPLFGWAPESDDFS